MLRPFRSGYLRSEALVVSGGENLSSPNYHQLHACMDGKEKKKTVNGN